MKNVRVDENGDLRCWKCGGRNFTEKRTMRSKAAVGVGALLTTKKLKCQSCGEYNDVGNAKPYGGPKSKRAARKAGVHDEQAAAQTDVEPAEIQTEADPAEIQASAENVISAADELQKYADLLDRGLISQGEFDAKKAGLL